MDHQVEMQNRRTVSLSRDKWKMFFLILLMSLMGLLPYSASHAGSGGILQGTKYDTDASGAELGEPMDADEVESGGNIDVFVVYKEGTSATLRKFTVGDGTVGTTFDLKTMFFTGTGFTATTMVVHDIDVVGEHLFYAGTVTDAANAYCFFAKSTQDGKAVWATILSGGKPAAAVGERSRTDSDGDPDGDLPKYRAIPASSGTQGKAIAVGPGGEVFGAGQHTTSSLGGSRYQYDASGAFQGPVVTITGSTVPNQHGGTAKFALFKMNGTNGDLASHKMHYWKWNYQLSQHGNVETGGNPDFSKAVTLSESFPYSDCIVEDITVSGTRIYLSGANPFVGNFTLSDFKDRSGNDGWESNQPIAAVKDNKSWADPDRALFQHETFHWLLDDTDNDSIEGTRSLNESGGTFAQKGNTNWTLPLNGSSTAAVYGFDSTTLDFASADASSAAFSFAYAKPDQGTSVSTHGLFNAVTFNANTDKVYVAGFEGSSGRQNGIVTRLSSALDNPTESRVKASDATANLKCVVQSMNVDDVGNLFVAGFANQGDTDFGDKTGIGSAERKFFWGKLSQDLAWQSVTQSGSHEPTAPASEVAISLPIGGRTLLLGYAKRPDLVFSEKITIRGEEVEESFKLSDTIGSTSNSLFSVIADSTGKLQRLVTLTIRANFGENGIVGDGAASVSPAAIDVENFNTGLPESPKTPNTTTYQVPTGESLKVTVPQDYYLKLNSSGTPVYLDPDGTRVPATATFEEEIRDNAKYRYTSTGYSIPETVTSGTTNEYTFTMDADLTVQFHWDAYYALEIASDFSDLGTPSPLTSQASGNPEPLADKKHWIKKEDQVVAQINGVAPHPDPTEFLTRFAVLGFEAEGSAATDQVLPVSDAKVIQLEPGKKFKAFTIGEGRQQTPSFSMAEPTKITYRWFTQNGIRIATTSLKATGDPEVRLDPVPDLSANPAVHNPVTFPDSLRSLFSQASPRSGADISWWFTGTTLSIRAKSSGSTSGKQPTGVLSQTGDLATLEADGSGETLGFGTGGTPVTLSKGASVTFQYGETIYKGLVDIGDQVEFVAARATGAFGQLDGTTPFLLDKRELATVDLSGRNFTIDFWAKRDRNSTEEYLLVHEDGAGNRLHIGFDAAGKFFASVRNGAAGVPVLASVSGGNDMAWHHWAVVYDKAGNSLKVFKDEGTPGKATLTGGYLGNFEDVPLILGYSPQLKLGFDGSIDNLRIWKEAKLTKSGTSFTDTLNLPRVDRAIVANASAFSSHAILPDLLLNRSFDSGITFFGSEAFGTGAPHSVAPKVIVIEGPAGTTSDNAVKWDDKNDRLYPVRPGRYLLRWRKSPAQLGDSVVYSFDNDEHHWYFDVFSRFPVQPHYRHVVNTPPVELDPSDEDRYAFLDMPFTESSRAQVNQANATFENDDPDGTVPGESTATSAGRSVLVFTDAGLDKIANGNEGTEDILVKVVESRALDTDTTAPFGQKPTVEVKSETGAIIGNTLTNPLTSPGTERGHAYRALARYNANFHDRVSGTGPIIPVNREFTDALEDDMLVVWYEKKDGIEWPAVPRLYDPMFPGQSPVLLYSDATGAGKTTGSVFEDSSKNFQSARLGDKLVITTGDNQGAYNITGVESGKLTIDGEFGSNGTGISYRVERPARRVVIASQLGSEGVDFANDPQPDFDTQLYDQVAIYSQNDPTLPGFNPNEEHALLAGSLLNAGKPDATLAAFALRNDQNLTGSSTAVARKSYTGEPFVLVQFRDLTTNPPTLGMYAYAVQASSETASHVKGAEVAFDSATASYRPITFTLASHGLRNGEEVFVNSVTGSGITAGRHYFVTGVKDDTFRLSTTLNGGAVVGDAPTQVQFTRTGSFYRYAPGTIGNTRTVYTPVDYTFAVGHTINTGEKVTVEFDGELPGFSLSGGEYEAVAATGGGIHVRPVGGGANVRTDNPAILTAVRLTSFLTFAENDFEIDNVTDPAPAKELVIKRTNHGLVDGQEVDVMTHSDLLLTLSTAFVERVDNDKFKLKRSRTSTPVTYAPVLSAAEQALLVDRFGKAADFDFSTFNPVKEIQVRDQLDVSRITNATSVVKQEIRFPQTSPPVSDGDGVTIRFSESFSGLISGDNYVVTAAEGDSFGLASTGTPANPLPFVFGTGGTIIDGDAAATTGTPVNIVPRSSGDLADLESQTAGNADASFAVGSGGPTVTVKDSDTPGGTPLYFDPNRNLFLAVIPSENDVYLSASGGKRIRVEHNSTAATRGVRVYFDDDAANTHERLLFVSPSNANSTYYFVEPEVTLLVGSTGTFNVSAIASPATGQFFVAGAGHGFVNNESVLVKPDPLDTSDTDGEKYFVTGAGPDGFSLKATLAGSPIAPTGSLPSLAVARLWSYTFDYRMRAGEPVIPPHPLPDVIGPTACVETRCQDGDPGQRTAFRDHKDQWWGVSGATSLIGRFYYPYLPNFDVTDRELGNPGDGIKLSDYNVGTCIPWLLDSGDLRYDSGDPQPRQANYQVFWPDSLLLPEEERQSVPVLKAGESLTYSGGEAKGDRERGGELDVAGLPGVLGWSAGQVVYDDQNPKMEESKVFGKYLVRLINPLEPRTVELALSALPDRLKPASGNVTVEGTRLFFKELHAGLQTRVYYDMLAQELVFFGLINDKTLGDDGLFAAPPSIFVLQPNIMTERERISLGEIGGTAAWGAAVNALHLLSNDPEELRQPYSVGLEETLAGGPFVGGAPKSQIGPGLAVIPNPALSGPAAGFESGYATLAENNREELGDAPVAMHIVKVSKGKYRGAVKPVFPPNIYDEKITARFTGDFGARPDNIQFQWIYREEDGLRLDPPPAEAPASDFASHGWKFFPDLTGRNGVGMNEAVFAGAGKITIQDNLVFVRWKHQGEPDVAASWSEWAGAANNFPDEDEYRAQLIDGWVKRVMRGLNPFDARFSDFRNNDAPATYASMIQQAGARQEGAIAFNPDKDVIESVGLIEAYQSVLDRAASLSIDLLSPQTGPGVNNAILLAASRVSDLYHLLGNEAYVDALNPTIGFGTGSGEYGNMAPAIFSFQNQLPTLLDEELTLLRGIPQLGAKPTYNRLIWNFTIGDGEVAYQMNYGIWDLNNDGFIDEADARTMYPMGHGDAWGHYTTALKAWYDLLGHRYFTWESRSELFQLEGQVIDVDYRDERKFARVAADRARAGTEIVNQTYRREYVSDPDGQWQGYKDVDPGRGWGVTEWAAKAAHGAFFDWAVGNALLPAEAPNQGARIGISSIDDISTIAGTGDSYEITLSDALADSTAYLLRIESGGERIGEAIFAPHEAVVSDDLVLDPASVASDGLKFTVSFPDGLPAPGLTADAFILELDERPRGIRRVDRTTVADLSEVANQGLAVQGVLDKANEGLNPLGVTPDIVPFDIPPAATDGDDLYHTHFDHIYSRTLTAVSNAKTAFDHANEFGNLLRENEGSVEELTQLAIDQDLDYRNQLIEIFGMPYEGQIGAGKTYPTGYLGPDLILFMYSDVSEISPRTIPTPEPDFQQDLQNFNLTKITTIDGENDVDGSDDDFLVDGLLSPFFSGDIAVGVGSGFATGPGNTVTYQSLTDTLTAHYETGEVRFPQASGDFSFHAPIEWGRRLAAGELQDLQMELIQAEAAIYSAVDSYTGHVAMMQDMMEMIEAQFDHDLKVLDADEDFRAAFRGYRAAIIVANTISNTSEFIAESFPRAADALADGVPKTNGTSNDGTFIGRMLTKIGAAVVADIAGITKIASDLAIDGLETGLDVAELSKDIAIQREDIALGMRERLYELAQASRDENVLRVEILAAQERLRQVAGQYTATLQRGARVLEERRNLNARIAASTTQSRYRDMTFRVARNDALQKYRAAFDFAARNCYTLGKVYDYETNLDPRDPASSQPLLQEIVRARTLGALADGEPMLEGGGLSEILFRLKSNYDVLKAQLGINNPQVESGRLSLRNELFRIKNDAEGDAVWRRTLEKHRVADLWTLPEFRRYCRPPQARSAGKLPGLVIPFQSYILAGKNFFGRSLGPGDFAYDPSNFATKARAAGVWLKKYNETVTTLSSSPRVYLVPVGNDIMTIPTSDDLTARIWNAVDQKLPVPLPIGSLELNDTNWIPMRDSVDGSLGEIRQYSSFRANAGSSATDTRLIGRSVWNTRWLLIVPGIHLLGDADEGITVLINGLRIPGDTTGVRDGNGISDIELFFDTFGYSGN